MAEIINMPRLSDTMEEGVVAKWLVKIGDKVSEGDILAEIETDKATMEFESFNEGTLLHIGINEGETAAVDTLLAIIGEDGEDISELITPSSSSLQLDLVDQINETENINSKEEEQLVEPELKNDSFQVVTMPRLSDTMEEGTVSSWLVNVGDTVNEGDILAEIETDKATMEFESFHEGTLLHIGINEGETAKVDSLLAIIGDPGSNFKSVLENFSVESAKKDIVENVPPKEEKIENSHVLHDPLVQKNEFISNDSRILASPLAKKIAKEKNIDISLIKGTGDNGRIIKDDVENYSSNQPVTSEDVKINT